MSKKYHFWITGCQMNYADARRVATELEKLGYTSTGRAEDADVIVLETCTVRQQSEDKAYGKLQNLRPLKEKNPEKTIAVMGCVVGVRGNEHFGTKVSLRRCLHGAFYRRQAACLSVAPG